MIVEDDFIEHLKKYSKRIQDRANDHKLNPNHNHNEVRFLEGTAFGIQLALEMIERERE